MERYITHVAIGCNDLDLAEEFYTRLGAVIGRRKDDRVSFNFFSIQLVCHLTFEVESLDSVYPRHYGILMTSRKNFDSIYKTARLYALGIYRPVSVRFAGKPDEHLTFFLADPSHNLIEFKCYTGDHIY